MTGTLKPLRIGFVGLGVMGHPMAGHLARAGHLVSVFDVDPEARNRFAASKPHAAIASTAAEVGAGADVVFTMLPDGEIVRSVVTGPDGLVTTMPSKSILVDTSSAQPWLTLETAAELESIGVGMIDAPVSGAQWGAESADLVFMVGGDSGHLERIRPLLELLGRAVFHVGPLGSGHIMKTINNTITAITFLGTAEGLVLGTRAGLDPAAMNAVLNESTGGSWITANHIEQRVLSRTFDDPFKLELMVKDIGIAARLGRELDMPLPVAELCDGLYRAANEQVGAGASVSEVVRWVEGRAEIQIIPSSTTS